MTMKKRLVLIVPDDIAVDVIEIKRDLFYDKSDSEMYRQLIRMGLDSLKTTKGKKGKKASENVQFATKLKNSKNRTG